MEENKGDRGLNAFDKEPVAPTDDKTNGGKRSELSEEPKEIQREMAYKVSFDPTVKTTILTIRNTSKIIHITPMDGFRF